MTTIPYHTHTFDAREIALLVAGDPLGFAFSDEVSPIEVKNACTTWRSPAFLLSKVRVSLTTEQTSGLLLTIDVKYYNTGTSAWTSIFSTPITMDNNSRTSEGAATPAVLAVTEFAYDTEMRLDVLQVGSGSAKGGKVYLEGTRT